ncbi:MAG: hypothetical protein ACXWPM_00395 [Bdellovibrionota bacterium]
MKIRLTLILTFASLGSCSSAPTPLDLYRSMEAGAKSIFIAYYPQMDAGQRRMLLNVEDPRLARRQVENWNLQPRGLDRSPASRTLTSLEILTDQNSPLTDARPIPLRAVLHYQDGRSLDVSNDVRWHALPELGAIDRNHVFRTDCAFSDVQVSANFYDEREGTRTFQIRRPLKNLELRVNEESLTPDGSEYVSLRLIAHCQDGSSSDVSCQASWSMARDFGQIGPCGNTHFQVSKGRYGDLTPVQASYGGLNVTKTVHLPSDPALRNAISSQ